MKKRTLNEYRQTKEYKLEKIEKAHKLNDAAKAKLHEFKDVEFDDLEIPSKSFVEDQEAAKQLAEKEPEEINLSTSDIAAIYNSGTPNIKKEITLKQQIEEIADIVVPTINDVIFNEIIEVMSNYDELNWGYFVQDDAPTALLDACYDHKQGIHYEIFQLVLQKLK
jgi:hypothetical protein